MIFFKSHSAIALSPAITMVKEAMRRRVGLNNGDWDKNGKNRIRRKTPAVTRVDECTKAETGVGAAIAAGNQLENGIWALLVIAAIIIIRAINESKSEAHIFIINQCPWFKAQPILSRSKQSPIRFVRAVIIPAPRDFGF